MEFKNVDVTLEEIEDSTVIIIKKSEASKKEEVEKEDYVMHLELDDEDNKLWIKVNDCNIAYLNRDKMFRLFRDEVRNVMLSNWRKGGHKKDNRITRAFGSGFKITNNNCLFEECISGCIFDFEFMQPINDCESNFVKKWESTNTPIIY